jgi:hypothetical protein
MATGYSVRLRRNYAHPHGCLCCSLSGSRRDLFHRPGGGAREDSWESNSRQTPAHRSNLPWHDPVPLWDTGGGPLMLHKIERPALSDRLFHISSPFFNLYRRLLARIRYRNHNRVRVRARGMGPVRPVGNRIEVMVHCGYRIMPYDTLNQRRSSLSAASKW